MAFSDPIRELLDLIAVHGFYISVLQKTLGHEIPLPNKAENPDKSAADHSIDILRRWLAVLDLAIAPVVVRDALKDSLPRETSEALMRYFMEKASHTEGDRDKTDCIATALYRNSPEGQKSPPDTADRYHFIAQMADAFESHIVSTLGDSGPQIKDEHRQLLKEFEFLHQEVDDFRTFDQLMDSGIVQRVRDIKQSFSDSFYNPKVLAQVAVYNNTFGKRFDELFRAATLQIKTFATAVQGEGASIMSRLDGDITVKHLADVEEHKIMNQEYGKAQENFRQISKFKKVVDKNDKNRGPRRPASVPVPAPAPSGGYQPVAAPQAGGSSMSHGSSPPGNTAHAKVEESKTSSTGAGGNALEDGKIRSQLDAIRTFVRVADKSCFVVPLVKGVINITTSEAEALRADFAAEKSFRADYANIVAFMLAVIARLLVEQEEFRGKQQSAYLWKPHADAITYIIQLSVSVIESANQILAVAEGRGLSEKAAALKATIAKFRGVLQQASGALRTAGEASAVV